MDQGKLIRYSATDSASTVASFPDWGVYEIKLTVADSESRQSVSRNTWVNVWDYRSANYRQGKARSPLCSPGGSTRRLPSVPCLLIPAHSSIHGFTAPTPTGRRSISGA